MHEWMRTIVLALPLIATAPGSVLQAQGAGNPACALLTAADLEHATGVAYDAPSPGDEMGQGAGGGASCQWGDPVGQGLPMISVVFIPFNGKKGYTEASRGVKMQPGCAREPVSGLGDEAFVQTCPRGRGPTVYFRKGKNDGIVQVDVTKAATGGSVKSKAIALAKAVVTHMP
jgi:hypothetical protein